MTIRRFVLFVGNILVNNAGILDKTFSFKYFYRKLDINHDTKKSIRRYRS